jgi:Holliday junction resolvase RusA-like endonuclease
VAVPDARVRDLDRVVNQIGDACNGVIWRDDSQIVEWHVRRVIDRERPRVEVLAVTGEATAAWVWADMRAMVGR